MPLILSDKISPDSISLRCLNGEPSLIGFYIATDLLILCPSIWEWNRYMQFLILDSEERSSFKFELAESGGFFRIAELLQNFIIV
jgi:hypothetical protein